MISNGVYLRQRLIEAGSRGIVFADAFKSRQDNDVIQHRGTYSSYVKLLQILRQLEWVVPTGEKEVAHGKGDGYQLHQSRTYYKITPEGLAHSEKDWSNPRLVLYPRPEGYKRKNYHKSKGGKRGRPRIAGQQQASE